MLIHFEGDGALHQRLYRGLRAAILDGRFPPRVRLPSTRSLASEMRVSRNVVVAAFAQLQGEGYIEGRVGSGTYVSATLPDPAGAPWYDCTSASSARRLETRLSQHAREVLSLRLLPAPGESRNLRGLLASAVPALVARAAASVVGIYPVAPYYLTPPRRAGLIFGYAALNERDIRAGVRAFAGVFDA